MSTLSDMGGSSGKSSPAPLTKRYVSRSLCRITGLVKAEGQRESWKESPGRPLDGQGSRAGRAWPRRTEAPELSSLGIGA